MAKKTSKGIVLAVVILILLLGLAGLAVGAAMKPGEKAAIQMRYRTTQVPRSVFMAVSGGLTLVGVLGLWVTLREK